MKTRITILMMATLLNACGSGSGGGSSSAPSDGGGCIVNCGGTGGGGSPTSNNGNATYYSLTTYPTDPPNEDQTSAPSGAWLIANKFFFKVTDAGQGHFDVGVFQPTCYVSSSGNYKDYAVVQLSGVIGQNSLSIRVHGGGAIIEDDAFDANIPDKKRVGAAATASGTCSQGKMTLSNGGVIFSNGEALVYKDANGELYAGFSSDVTLKTGTHTNNDISIDDGVLATAFNFYWNDTTDAFNGVESISNNTMGDTFRVYNGTVKMSSNRTVKLVPNGIVSVSNAHHFLIYDVGFYYESVIAKISGKTIILASDGSGSCTNSGGSYESCTGVTRVWTVMEQ